MNLVFSTKLVGVVIRKLGNSRPVSSLVIKQSEDPNIDDHVHYLISKGKEHVEEFTTKFVEFKRADWYIDVIMEMTGDLVDSEEIHPNPPVSP